MKARPSLNVSILAALLFQLCPSAQAVMWDDFSTYPYGIALTQGFPAGPNSP
jgi:hypothetical protein